MKKGQLVKSRISASPVNPFERMKRVYINQISRSDSVPQKVIFDQILDCGKSVSWVGWRRL